MELKSSLKTFCIVNNQSVKIILIPLIFFSLSGCREGIIEPDNLVGNVNQPVQLFDRNSYTLLLDAKNLEMNLSVPMYFSSTRTRFNVTLNSYESGFTTVSVQDYSRIERFRYFISDDVSYHTELLDGYIPNTINISMQNFTGKIKIEFRKTL